ncbi:MAG: hypothetical protein ACAH65_06550 [Chloroflexota bacterium]
MKPGSGAWWQGKVRQVGRHLAARVHPAERTALEGWLTPGQLDLFDRMHLADRRHGLDVVSALRRDGVSEPDALIAGLLHDAGKGNTGLVPRVTYSLGQAYGRWIPRALAWLPGMRPALRRLDGHADSSARLAEAAGCTPRTVELIRWQDAPRDPEFGERLKLADERS